jgi:hypothetical protein
MRRRALSMHSCTKARRCYWHCSVPHFTNMPGDQTHAPLCQPGGEHFGFNILQQASADMRDYRQARIDAYRGAAEDWGDGEGL